MPQHRRRADRDGISDERQCGHPPLQEKVALFWHGVFATGLAKVLHEKTMAEQIDMLRAHGLGSFRDLLVQLARDPAMIFWLDNNFNHKDAINEKLGPRVAGALFPWASVWMAAPITLKKTYRKPPGRSPVGH